MNDLIAMLIVIGYFIIAAAIALLCRRFIKIPNEIFRKILHCIMLFSVLIIVFCFKTWWIATLFSISIVILAYPILTISERYKSYSYMVTERKKGELKQSLIMVFIMFAIVISVCWGLFGNKYLVLASIYAWGFGDAAAALVGKRFGKHKIKFKNVDNKKSFEGSFAMFIVSLLCLLIIFFCNINIGVLGIIITSLITAMISTIGELYSKNGYDTVICPLSAMIVLIPLVYLFGGIV